MQEETVSHNHFLADQPITSPNQDRLGRLQFAEDLGRRLLEYDQPASLVVALYGPWGSGKSSLLNLMAEVLTTETGSQYRNPIVVHFNPWNYTSIEQLTTMFFRELTAAIGGDGSDKLLRGLGSTLEAFGTILSVGQLSPLGSQYIGVAATSSKELGKKLKEVKSKRLEEIKDDLNGQLEKLNRRLIVLIDDLDRLDSESMRLMFRLIRLSADFTNTTYVLAFDREVAHRVLRDEQSGSGQEYLEKIVQVGLDIPPANPTQLRKMFLEQLHNLIQPIPNEEWDNDYWNELWVGGLFRLFRTPRDVARYTNGLRAMVPSLVGEVNTVDVIGLEAIRVFASPAYIFIRNNQYLFLGPTGGPRLKVLLNLRCSEGNGRIG